MNLLNALRQPYYLLRPSQLFRRISSDFRPAREGYVLVHLPWEIDILCNPQEAIGHSLVTAGIYDLLLSEMLCRLIDRGDITVDVGANIGYCTGLMAYKSGPSGNVLAFEPHPALFPLLESNVRRRADRIGPIQLFQLALSDSEGTGMLHEPAGFLHNCGLASLVNGDRAVAGTPVGIKRLDSLFSTTSPTVGLVKIDVEGNELAVLAGSESLLRGHAIRDIVFEEFAPFPAPTHVMLQQIGYTIFHSEPCLAGPRLRPTERGFVAPGDRPPNYLATLEPGRAVRRFTQHGWRCLNPPKTLCKAQAH